MDNDEGLDDADLDDYEAKSVVDFIKSQRNYIKEIAIGQKMDEASVKITSLTRGFM